MKSQGQSYPQMQPAHGAKYWVTVRARLVTMQFRTQEWDSVFAATTAGSFQVLDELLSRV
eukprot:3770297-Amphidinium_carterae.2